MTQYVTRSVVAPVLRRATEDKAPEHVLPHKFNAVEPDTDALAALIEQACNELAALRFEVVSVQLTTAGRYGDPNAGVTGGCSYTNGALITARRA